MRRRARAEDVREGVCKGNGMRMCMCMRCEGQGRGKGKANGESMDEGEGACAYMVRVCMGKGKRMGEGKGACACMERVCMHASAGARAWAWERAGVGWRECGRARGRECKRARARGIRRGVRVRARGTFACVGKAGARRMCMCMYSACVNGQWREHGRGRGRMRMYGACMQACVERGRGRGRIGDGEGACM